MLITLWKLSSGILTCCSLLTDLCHAKTRQSPELTMGGSNAAEIATPTSEFTFVFATDNATPT
jgi:hypothetical protein